jgi:ketosteroid isomerase-like protein
MHPLIRQYYQAFNSGDREALLALLHPDIVHEINEGGVEVGIPAFALSLVAWTVPTASRWRT